MQFIICDIISEQLIKETAQLLQVLAPNMDLCKSLYFPPINCSVLSVNCSVRSVLIKCRAQSYVTRSLLCQNEQEKICPSVLHWRLPKFEKIVGPNNFQFFTQFCAETNCSVKLSVYGLLYCCRDLLFLLQCNNKWPPIASPAWYRVFGLKLADNLVDCQVWYSVMIIKFLFKRNDLLFGK